MAGRKGKVSGDKITEAEYAVMEALWARYPATAAEICATVCDNQGWSMPTVKTLLSRLTGKSAIAAEPDGRRFLYSPLIDRKDYVGSESRRMMDRLFGGKPATLFAHLAESEALSDDDLAEIEILLKEMRK